MSGATVIISPAGYSVDPYAPRAPLGGDLYLDWTAGSDGSGTSASPWNTLSAARVQSLAAGQSLFVKGTGAWPDTTGAASGTSSSRIQVAKWPGFSGGFTFTGNGARLGGGDYWDWNGLSLTCDNFGLCLRENASLSGGVAAKYFRLIDCVGTRTSVSYTDNSGVLWVNGGGDFANTPITIIRGSYSGPAAANNQSLLWFDYTTNVQIIGTLLDGTANPIYFKHTSVNSSATPGGLVKNCIIRNGGRGFQAAANWVQYVNNVFDTCILGLDESGGGVPGGNNCTISHCTFYNSSISAAITDAGVTTHLNNTLTNNVLAGTSQWQDNPFGANSNQDQNNLSDYSACDGSAVNHFYRDGSSRTLASHKSAFPTQEVHGVAGTITFAGAAGPTASVWALQSGSAGKNAASDGTDCGVNAANLLTVN